ncbi:protein of unknown function [Pseudomonas marincola]|uniref:Uncharacterized protein n=1 Tax=Pseudomonas marincola TaxID=437900 RepID=A0A8S2BE09_9PSED|nr:protein of unknown function [Pseudomonas marincola]
MLPARGLTRAEHISLQSRPSRQFLNLQPHIFFLPIAQRPNLEPCLYTAWPTLLWSKACSMQQQVGFESIAKVL